MNDLITVIKTLILSYLIMLGLQMKWHEITLEQHAERWVRTSPLVNYLEKVARGSNLFLQNATEYSTNYLYEAMGKPRPKESLHSTHSDYFEGNDETKEVFEKVEKNELNILKAPNPTDPAGTRLNFKLKRSFDPNPGP